MYSDGMSSREWLRYSDDEIVEFIKNGRFVPCHTSLTSALAAGRFNLFFNVFCAHCQEGTTDVNLKHSLQTALYFCCRTHKYEWARTILDALKASSPISGDNVDNLVYVLRMIGDETLKLDVHVWFNSGDYKIPIEQICLNDFSQVIAKAISTP